MLVAYNKTLINPTEPMVAPGFATNTIATKEVQGDLYLSYLRFKAEKHEVVYLLMDSLGVSYKIFQDLKHAMQQELGSNVEFALSCTHTHFAPPLTNLFGLSSENYTYYAQVEQAMLTMIRETPLIAGEYTINYRHQNYTEVGQSRLSHRGSTNVYSGVLSIYRDKVRIINFLFYNCHPTILNETPGYLTAEYPGFTVATLSAKYPNEFFGFLQGAAGDVSTRFVRKEKNMAEVKRLAGLMSEQFDRLLALPAAQEPLTLSYQDFPLTIDYQVKNITDIDTSQMAEKEIREVNTGLAARDKLLSRLPYYPREIVLSKLHLGGFTLILSPFEMFSEYNDFIKRGNELLVCYSQGYITYLTGPNNQVITYEALMEMQTEADKAKIVAILSENA